MHLKHVLPTALVLLALVPAPTAAVAQAWEQLGCRDVDFRVDRDVIRVGRRDGRFTAIRLRASGNDVRMLDLKVVYGNGAPDDIPVRAMIPAGGSSGVLDLKGRERVIERIEMIYASRPNFRGHARICVEGRDARAQAPSPAPSANWVTLGCRAVNFTIDRDVIPVGRRDGRFTAIRLRASGNDVRVLDLKVVYGNGVPDDIPVRAVIAAGRTSGVLDLKGRDRAIDRIQMIYASRPDFRGRAEVCVEGRPS